MKHIGLSALFLLLTAACGFSPMHSASPSGSGALPSMAIEFTGSRAATSETAREMEFLLGQALQSRMSDSHSNPYTLSLSPQLRRSTIGVTADDIASRYDLTLQVRYILTDSATGEILDRDTLSAVSTFGAARDPYARISAQDSAEERLASQISDKLVIAVRRAFAS